MERRLGGKWKGGEITHTMQQDTFSCGVFVMQLAQEFAQNFPNIPSQIDIEPSQKHMEQLQKEMAEDILKMSEFNKANNCFMCATDKEPGCGPKTDLIAINNHVRNFANALVLLLNNQPVYGQTQQLSRTETTEADYRPTPHHSIFYGSNIMLVFLLWASLFLSSLQEQNGQDALGVLLSGPQNVSVNYDLKDQRISVTWEDDPSSSRVPDKLIYDVEVLLTVNMTEVHSEAVDVRQALASRKYHWSWTSALPLECTSHSVRLRSRYQNYTSQWSPLLTITGRASSHPQVFPKSSVVQVDSNFTFCCILGPGQRLEYMKYNNILMNTTHIIDQSYAMVVHMQSPSPPSCINVYCNSPLYGTCVYVGYPPGDRNLVCETRDLESVECHWDTGRATNLTKQRMTRYDLNGRACPNRTVSNCYQTVRVDQGERNWTLTARNPLGTLELRDTADLKKRVRLLAPMEVVASGVNASVQWQWERPQYHILLMVCQVQLNHSGHIDVRNFSGIGLRSVVLHGLAPAQTYTVHVCCGLKQHFWKWGDWSEGSTFKTEEDIPEMLDVWMQIEGNQTMILWKPLTVNQSHGQIKDYEVTWGRQETILHPPQNDFLISDRSTDEGHRVTVTAKNSAGSSLPSIIIIPRLPIRSKSSMKIVGSDGGFNLSWSASPNSSCGYVVDWCPTHKKCRVEWVKVPAGITRARIQSASFEEGVRYTLSIFACTPGAPELWERREGYVKECLPKGPIQRLAAEQHGSDTVLISWTGIPPENQTAFIHGYIIYYFDTSHPSSMRIFNVTTDEPGAKNLTGIPVSSYRFIVKALTSVGEGGDSSPVFLQMNPQTDQLITVIIIFLGSAACLLALVTILCYRNWKCVKENLYPKIPQPVWKEEWLTPLESNGRQILYVDPCQPSEIDIVCNREQSGEAVLDNNAGKGALTNTNSDVPALHGYYNQLLTKTTSGHFTFSPHTMATPFSQLSGTVIQNPSYNLEVQASLDMGQSVGYEPDMNSFSCPNPELHNTMSYVPFETDSRGYKFQCHIEDSSPLQE